MGIANKLPIACRLFGHKHNPDYCGSLDVTLTDGMSTFHCAVTVKCPRCLTRFPLARVYLPPKDKLDRFLASGARECV